MLTKDAIEKRLAMLEKDYESTIANANAISGAIQDCKYWLEQLATVDIKEQGELTTLPDTSTNQ